MKFPSCTNNAHWRLGHICLPFPSIWNQLDVFLYSEAAHYNFHRWKLTVCDSLLWLRDTVWRETKAVKYLKSALELWKKPLNYFQEIILESLKLSSGFQPLKNLSLRENKNLGLHFIVSQVVLLIFLCFPVLWRKKIAFCCKRTQSPRLPGSAKYATGRTEEMGVNFTLQNHVRPCARVIPIYKTQLYMIKTIL